MYKMRTPHANYYSICKLNCPLRLRKLTALSSHRAEVSGEGKAVVLKVRLFGLLLYLVTAPQGECPQILTWVQGEVVTEFERL
jgi:hypothetical protein